MILTITTIFFVLGLIIGSFLNVVIIRLNTERSLGGRSGCMSCRKTLTWYELIPVLSFIALGGRCKGCKIKISRQYPIVEFLTGAIFAALFLKFQDIFFLDTLVFTLSYAYYAAVSTLLVVIAAYDLKHKIIPDTLSLIFGILTFSGLFFFGGEAGDVFSPHLPSLWNLLAGLMVSVPFALFWLVSRGAWMGLGDAKLAVGLGWLLGPSRLFSGVTLAFWIGATVGIILILFTRNHKMKSEIPFAPYLVLGSLLAFLLGLHIFALGF